ncbi:MAG: hypothetical protein WC501_05200 [Candidatus Micrarchaeia archaeon]
MAQMLVQNKPDFDKTPEKVYDKSYIGPIWSNITIGIAGMPKREQAIEKMNTCISNLKKAKTADEVFNAIKPIVEMIRIIGDQNEIGYWNSNITYSLDNAIRHKKINCASGNAMLGNIIDEMMQKAGKSDFNVDIAMVGSIDNLDRIWSGTNEAFHCIVRVSYNKKIRYFDARTVDDFNFDIMPDNKSKNTAYIDVDVKGMPVRYITYRITDFVSLKGLEKYLELAQKQGVDNKLVTYIDLENTPAALVRNLNLTEKQIGFLGFYDLERLQEIKSPLTRIQVILTAIEKTADDNKLYLLSDYLNVLILDLQNEGTLKDIGNSLDLTRQLGALSKAYWYMDDLRKNGIAGLIIFAINNRRIDGLDKEVVVESAKILLNLEVIPANAYAMFRYRELLKRMDMQDSEIFNTLTEKLDEQLNKEHVGVLQLDKIEPEATDVSQIPEKRWQYADIIIKNLLLGQKSKNNEQTNDAKNLLTQLEDNSPGKQKRVEAAFEKLKGYKI